MEHFAPFVSNTASARYETAELVSSITLVQDAVREREEGEEFESHELPGRGTYPGHGLGNFHEIPTTARPTNPSPSPSSPPPNPRQTGPAGRPGATLNNPFNAFDTPEFYWHPASPTTTTPTAHAAPPPPPPPPRRRYKPVESPQFLPEYVVDNFLKANPGQDGFFCVFRKTYILKSDGMTTHEGALPANQTTFWRADKVLGHLFEVTEWGSLVYHGPFKDDESEFVGYWSKKSTIKAVSPPENEATHTLLYFPKPGYHNSSSTLIRLDSLASITPRQSRSSEYHLEMVQESCTSPGESCRHKKDVDWPWRESWRRLFNVAGCETNPTQSLLYMNFPQLIAFIVSTGRVPPRQVFRYLSLAKKNVAVYGQNSPVQVSVNRASKDHYYKYYYPSITLRIPLGGWEDQGWNYTELGSMGVLIS
ncbi:hypothetical protein TWF481_005446 [Arthrobotrys musiformis]|uniref:Uncharacterized protein n=1 Tax=Arthrobotrys musiformis TaxID=47236 RepID=A0AAV9WEG9_9PEZI